MYIHIYMYIIYVYTYNMETPQLLSFYPHGKSHMFRTNQLTSFPDSFILLNVICFLISLFSLLLVNFIALHFT